MAGDIVTTINVVDVAAINQDTGRETGRESVISQIGCFSIHIFIGLCIQSLRTDVSLTAAAIYIINKEQFLLCIGAIGERVYLQQQTRRAGHTALVTTAVQILNMSCHQVPVGLDTHLSLVVAAEDTGEVVNVTHGILAKYSDTHGGQPISVGQIVLF